MPLRKFKKASPEQAYLKVGWYGAQSTGKTFTELLVGEWLIEQENKKFAALKENKGVEPPYRMLYIDTERGTDFYARPVAERKVHPEAFDFDREVTRSVMEVKDIFIELRNDPGRYKVVIIDSMTHLWEAAKEAYAGKRIKDNQIPITGWGSVKRPIKLINECGLNGAFHWFFAGREGLIYEKDEDTGEEGVTGYRMKAEGEQPYEPHILVQMYKYRNAKTQETQIRAYIEKDRSGCMQEQTIIWPKADMLSRVYELLSGEQGTFTTSDDAAAKDIKKAYDDDAKATTESQVLFETIRKAIMDASNKLELKTAWELTTNKKKYLGPDNFEVLSGLTDQRIAEMNKLEAVKARVDTNVPVKTEEKKEGKEAN